MKESMINLLKHLINTIIILFLWACGAITALIGFILLIDAYLENGSVWTERAILSGAGTLISSMIIIAGILAAWSATEHIVIFKD